MQSINTLCDAIVRQGTVRRGALAAVLVLSLVVAACGSGVRQAPLAGVSAGQEISGAGDGLTVTCAEGQQALVRQVVVNGRAQTAVECASADLRGPAPVRRAESTVAWEAARQQSLTAVRAPEATVAARPAAYRSDGDLLTYVPRARAPRRSVQKSVLIIGSSAGVGAGIGAAAGGKKGALIGAAIGGGAATIWDQATRRK